MVTDNSVLFTIKNELLKRVKLCQKKSILINIRIELVITEMVQNTENMNTNTRADEVHLRSTLTRVKLGGQNKNSENLVWKPEIELGIEQQEKEKIDIGD